MRQPTPPEAVEADVSGLGVDIGCHIIVTSDHHRDMRVMSTLLRDYGVSQYCASCPLYYHHWDMRIADHVNRRVHVMLIVWNPTMPDKPLAESAQSWGLSDGGAHPQMGSASVRIHGC